VSLPRQSPPSVPAPRAVLSTVPSDSHTWNLLFLRLLLEEQGWQVVNLGACVPVETLVTACTTHRPDLVVVSSVNGHGAAEGPDVARAVRSAPGLAGVPLVIGGKLDTSGSSDPADFPQLTEAGFDAVFVGRQAVPGLLALLDRLAAGDGTGRRAFADAAL
jgi:methylaspartate mutase sigma subunit